MLIACISSQMFITHVKHNLNMCGPKHMLMNTCGNFSRVQYLYLTLFASCISSYLFVSISSNKFLYMFYHAYFSSLFVMSIFSSFRHFYFRSMDNSLVSFSLQWRRDCARQTSVCLCMTMDVRVTWSVQEVSVEMTHDHKLRMFLSQNFKLL